MFSNAPKATSNDGGVVPGNKPSIGNNDGRKAVHYIEQIFDPDIHPIELMSKYIVPEEGELVVDMPNHVFYEVEHVDRHATWKTTLGPWNPIPEASGNDYTLFPKHEYGFLQGEMALMIDYSVRPPVARVDANCVAPNAAYAHLYNGDVFQDTDIISATYSGVDFIDNKIPVSPVVLDNFENLTIMGANTFSVQRSDKELPNGSRCSLIFKDQAGRPIPPIYPLAVQHCSHLRDHELGTRYVKSIELISPWFTNTSNPKTLFIRINVLLKTVEFRARVHYSDGTSSDPVPVNTFNGNNGFKLLGLDQWKPTVPGQSSDSLVLTYAFAEHEQAYMAQPGQPRHMSEKYTIVAVPGEGTYTPRIYSYPYWDNMNGWKLKHFLTDLDRKYCRDVTDIVTLNESSPAFDGRKYGEEQNLIFNLNMRDVSASYEPWSFMQHTSPTLYNDATAEGRKWDVRHSRGKPPFVSMTVEYIAQAGGGVKAKFAGIANDKEFLDKGYWAFDPLMDPLTEIKAPTPTHFDLVRVNGSVRTGIPIAGWKELPIDAFSLTPGEGLFIRWVRRESDGNELQLGVSAAVSKKVSVFS
ncbi:virion structural protein [Aeromonas phage LAh10]|uniref:Virion structural protein n=1 Tax=Aeromonas phage LAh10 TaxID=2591025 RepID=A0A514A1C1_9CAUD|nr:virion structural protein [Aeromonas phage LAh10]QDH47035.1 hypothetical protein LAh10_174 [Aeromonas phage LAh10]